MTSIIIFKTIGALGLILICIGMIVKKRRIRDAISVFGGIALLTYSLYLHDIIFIILQTVYTVVVIFDYYKQNKKHA